MLQGMGGWLMYYAPHGLLLIFIILPLVLYASRMYFWNGFVHDLGRIETKINPNVYYVYGAAEMQGKRQYMEDRHIAMGELNGNRKHSLYGVFDGHGGSKAAQFCVDQMCHNIIKEPNFNKDPKRSLVNGILQTDRQYLELANRLGRDDGTTAVVALIQGDQIYVANVGDSRAILIQKNGKSLPLSSDHKPNRVDERRRIDELGGSVVFWGVWRVEGILAVSRAIGDRLLKRYVISEPEIQSWNRAEQDHFIVLASDGVWDVLSNEEVGRLVIQSEHPQKAANLIMEEAYGRGSLDNISVLVIDLRASINAA